MNDFIWPEDDGKVHRPDLFFDYVGDMTLLAHEGKKADEFFPKYFTIPYPSSTENY